MASRMRKARKARQSKPASRRSSAAESPASNAFLELLTELQPNIEQRLARYLDAKVLSARALGPEVAALVHEVRRLSLRGGKRLRPALVVAGFKAASSTNSATLEPALDAGVALELLHTYFLIHDDWMDGDRVRRGGPAVHVALAARFRSEHKGNASAILAGDYAVALACDALARVDAAPPRLRGAFSAFAEMQLGAVAGQQLDMVGSGRDIELGYALKTGSYTVEGPLKLGALLAGAKPQLLEALARFARPAGIAFQLRDDLLSLFGDPKRTGKPLASDLMSGKRTLLLTLALQNAKRADAAAIRKVVGNPRATSSQVKSSLLAVHESGAPALIEARIDELAELASAELGQGFSGIGRSLLLGATQALAQRRT
jgi:geranylgeranyl diphosphate synthase type I